MNFIEKEVKNYLDFYIKKNDKFAVALSGGPDSMALFFAIKAVRKPDLVLHIHHGMRKESDQEMILLRNLVEKESIQFQVEKIEDFDFSSGNIEDRLREERFKKYSQVLSHYGISHLFTGHQKNDAEENIFKRVFEGSCIFKIGKILKPAFILNFHLHRPLIAISKKLLLEYLEQNKISYFEDTTNQDTRFLRSRMRLNLFPYINKVFGKNIEGKLYDLGFSLNEMDQYLQSKCEKYLNQVITGPIGLLFIRTKIEPLELKYLLIELTNHLSAIITKDQLSTVIELYFRGISNKKVQLRNFTIYIEKCGIIFYNLKNFSLKGELNNQTPPSSDFKAFWKGDLASIRKESLPFFIRKMHGSIKCPQVLNTDDFLWSLEAKD